MLILLSIGLVIAQMLLGNASVAALWANWFFAGLISLGVWNVTKRFHLCGVNEGKSITISWPLLSACMNFSLCYFPRTETFYVGVILILAMLAVLSMILSVWQDTRSVGTHLLIGIIVGLSSTLLPHTLLWLLLLPLISYHMRSLSLRNTFGVLTGAIWGIWLVYCFLFFCEQLMGPSATFFVPADQMISNYAILFQPQDFGQIVPVMGLWQWLFLGLIILLVVIYSISAMLINAGNSIRAGASISLISTLSISVVVVSLLDITHLPFYISLLSLFFSIQLTIHQSNVHTTFNEWWTLFILLAMIALTALPLWF